MLGYHHTRLECCLEPGNAWFASRIQVLWISGESFYNKMASVEKISVTQSCSGPLSGGSHLKLRVERRTFPAPKAVTFGMDLTSPYFLVIAVEISIENRL